jgi:hypothetical protein
MDGEKDRDSVDSRRFLKKPWPEGQSMSSTAATLLQKFEGALLHVAQANNGVSDPCPQ